MRQMTRRDLRRGARGIGPGLRGIPRDASYWPLVNRGKKEAEAAISPGPPSTPGIPTTGSLAARLLGPGRTGEVLETTTKSPTRLMSTVSPGSGAGVGGAPLRRRCHRYLVAYL